MKQEIADLGLAIMQELAVLNADDAYTGVSAAKLCKRLGVRMSSMQRALAYFGETGMADSLGWVQAAQQEDRLMLSLSAAGWAQVQLWQSEAQTGSAADQTTEQMEQMNQIGQAT